jgi:hypothetical protein
LAAPAGLQGRQQVGAGADLADRLEAGQQQLGAGEAGDGQHQHGQVALHLARVQHRQRAADQQHQAGRQRPRLVGRVQHRLAGMAGQARHEGHEAEQAGAQQGGQAGGQHAAAAAADVEVVRHQQGHGREHRHDVAGQLGIRLGEEQDDEGDPHQQQQARLEAGRLRSGFARQARLAPARPARARCRRPAATKKTYQAASRWWVLLQEAVEVFVDEEEVRLLGVLQADQHEPGRGDQEEQQQALAQVQAGPDLPVARKQRVQHQHAARQHQPIRPFASTDSAMPAQHTSIQLRCSAGVALVALGQQQGAQGMVIMPDRLMSSELIWLQATQ